MQCPSRGRDSFTTTIWLLWCQTTFMALMHSMHHSNLLVLLPIEHLPLAAIWQHHKILALAWWVVTQVMMSKVHHLFHSQHPNTHPLPFHPPPLHPANQNASILHLMMMLIPCLSSQVLSQAHRPSINTILAPQHSTLLALRWTRWATHLQMASLRNQRHIAILTTLHSTGQRLPKASKGLSRVWLMSRRLQSWTCLRPTWQQWTCS